MAAVTVFMPVYNAMPYLPEAVESIRRQSLRDWVFLIVDDGSTDGSRAYLDGLRDARIRVLSQAHQGPAAASNRALALCDTELLARMDADDVADPARLAAQLDFLRRRPQVGLLGTQVRRLGAARAGRPSCLPTDHAAIFAGLMAGRHAMCNPTIMARTALLREVGGYQADGVLEDWTMFLSMGSRAELANLDRPLLWYRVHAKSTNVRHTAELRSRVAFACQRARQRQQGTRPISYEEFQAARRAAPAPRRALWAMEAYAMTQYQRGLAESLGPRRAAGYARLAWAAFCSPQLAFQRLARMLRTRLGALNRGRCNPLSKRTGGTETGVPLLATSSAETAAGALLLRSSGTLPGTSSSTCPAGRNGWPPKYDLFGVRVSATDYEEATDAILAAARNGRGAVASLHAVHALITAGQDPALRDAVNGFEIVAPDGQPVRWALGLLHGVRLKDRVYGPELMRRLCRRAAAEHLGVYLYGSSPEVLGRLAANLVREHPGLVIAGAESPPFRPLQAAEEEETVRRIEASGARLVLVGLGAPKQDWFAHRVRSRVRAAVVCVGAAFDFHAGTKRMAPAWMQRRGLEWLFRLLCEPRRLARRYLVTNTIFLAKLAGAMLHRPRTPHAPREGSLTRSVRSTAWTQPGRGGKIVL